MTAATHRSGTDRIAEAVASLQLTPDAIVVNIQGDQPVFEPTQVDEVIAPLLADPSINMSTLIYKIIRDEEITHPNAVKVAFDYNGFALYFSRHSIPFIRDEKPAEIIHYKHIGLYGYTKDFLFTYKALAESKLEKLEKLEQLRILENGYRIKLVETSFETFGVDTPEDLEKVKQRL